MIPGATTTAGTGVEVGLQPPVGLAHDISTYIYKYNE